MAKQLNVNLAFTADTEKAKQQIAELYRTLNQVASASASSPNLFNTAQLKEGINAAKELRNHLQAAVDVNTGKLNLSALSASLKSSGKSLSTYKTQLEALGPSGEKAFLQVSRAIATADAPLRKTNSLLREFSTTMKNTIRWQISSSMLHGFMGAVSSAVGYAKDLNESLNNIRIVTGNSTEEMAKFAKEANRAAKALSTTTTDYTDAALIYYQQGLNEEQVKKRTDITIKMANVSRQSAEEVSDQMTAVWNNFYDGSQSLEHFADVMTRLGADTASSSDEIAQGLEKFAAIGDMIGLSFDNAAAALATVTATTRQSADVVGTAFKTIFARIQGLSLGETLDDGTNLNKYSKALEAVGISIKEQNGELKDMDSILAEMGAKWNTLSNDQQVALAQTVAGVRQYNQLIALMDHFDFYEQNLAAAQNSDGSLQEQADIYAESWEAAEKRVKAAAENIYDSLLDDEFFIKLTNAFAIFLEGLGGFVDGFGGMEGVLSMIGGFITQKLAKEAPAALNTIKQNLMQITGQAHQIANKEQQDNISWLGNEAVSSMNTFQEGEGSLAYAAEVATLEKIAIQKNKLIQYESQYSEAEKVAAQQEIAHLEMTSDILVKKGQDYDKLNTSSQTAYDTIISKLQDVKNSDGSIKKTKIELIEMIDNIQDLGKQDGNLNALKKALLDLPDSLQATGDSAEQAKNKLLAIAKSAKSVTSGNTRQGFDELIKRLNNLGTAAQQGDDSLDKIANDLKSQVGSAATTASDNLNQAEKEFLGLGNATGLTGPQLKSFISLLKSLGIISAEVPLSIETMGSTMDKLKPHVATGIEALTSFSGTLMSMNALWSSITSAKDVFTDEDATAIEKVGAAIGVLTSGMMFFNSVSQLTNTLLATETKNKLLNWAVTKLQSAAEKSLAKTKTTTTKATIAQTIADWALNASLGPLLIVILSIVAAFTALALIIWGVTAAFKAIQAASPEGKLKAAKEEAARLGEELNKAKEASDALKDSIDKYDSAVDKIKTLEEGTREWREAIHEANDAARELIDNNEELAGKYSFNADTGLIEFEDGALEAAQDAAYKKEKSIQAQKMMADNAVGSSEIAVSNNRAVEENNAMNGWIAAGLTAASTLFLPGIGMALGPILSGVLAASQESDDNKQTKALEALQEAYYQTGGNIAEAWLQLQPETKRLVESLGLTDAQLEELCQASAANTHAILERNKQIIDTNFEDNKAYQNSSNKAYLSELLAGDLSEKTDQLYENEFKDGLGLTDAQVQKKYAELMGWDANLVKNKMGNKAVYINEEGEEVTISDEQVRRYLAQQKALEKVEETVETTSQTITKLSLAEKNLAKNADGSIKSYEEYKKTMHDFGKELGLTQKEIDSYIQKYGGMQDAAKKEIISKNVQKWGYDKKNSDTAIETFAKNLQDTNGVSVSDQLQIMVDVSATAESYDEFKRGFEQALNEAVYNSLQNSASAVEGIMKSVEETGKITSDDISTLEQDENFQEYLEATGQTMLDFTKKTFSERYHIITSFYADLKAAEYESLETSKENYRADLAEYQAILDYKKSLNEDNSETAASQAIKDQWGDRIDFQAYMDMDISEVESKMDEIQDAIDEIDGQQIKLDLEWESTDAVENSLKKIGSFTKTLENDAKKVGDSYQLTAAQAKEWMQVYPELFAEAGHTTDGLITLNANYVNDFIDGQEASADAAIQTNIDMLESRLNELEGERAAYAADLELAKSNAVGKEKLATASKEYLAETRDKLTQYYIDCGMDEMAAQKAALDTMGLNEQEYSELVANAVTRNAENQIAASEQAAEGQVSVLSQLWTKFKSWASKVGNLLKNVWKALIGEITWSDVADSWSSGGIKATTSVTGLTGYDEQGNFQAGNEFTRTATLEEINKASAAEYEAKIADIDHRLASIRSEIAYNKALQAQTLDNYGSTDPNNVDGTKGKNDGSKKDAKDLKKIAERYHEITKEIETQEYLLDKISKAKDRAYGKDKIKLIDQEIESLNKLKEKNQELYDAQTLFLAMDQVTVQEKFGNATFDENGNISNYSALIQQATDELNAVINKYNNVKTEEAEKAVEEAEKKYEENIAVLEQYEETLSALREQEQKLIDLQYKIQDANYEKLQESLTLKLEIDDAELKKLEYFLNKYSDNFYKMAESAALMNDKIDPTIQKLEDYKSHKEALDKAYENGKISQEAYIEGLKEVREGYYDNLEALIELDKEMIHYYGDTLDAASEELSSFTDHMEHFTSVFDHYTNLMKILGKQKDYDVMGNFLSGKADTIRDRLDVAKEYYEMLQKNSKADEYWANYQAALAEGDDDMAAWWKEQWDAEVDALDAAQEEMLGLTEDWTEAMKSVIQNNMEKIADTLEKTLTGGTTFDTLMDGFDKLNTRQEEYLTKTNQVYETNKLMRTASKALDETDNKVAKQKLKNFIDETKGLQETTQLSKYELEIQQAKYDLLLAQIALEEAQNAKSTVRLSRDNEGNFGYVYTADQNKIDDAQQAVDDADNKLYNLSLEGQQQYTEKYLQAEQAMYEELKQLQQDYLDGNIASEEEYELRKSQIQEHYLGPEGVLTTYSKLYNIAVQTDANATADYWGQEYGRMTQDTEVWKTAVNNYLLEIDGQIEEWKNVQTTANSDVGGALNNSKKATEELTTESRNLRDTINDEVIPAISDEIKKVQEQTGAYADQRQKLLDLIATYEDYLKKLDATISANSIGFDKNTDYSALMNEYLNSGGKTSDKAFQDLLKQRNAKIEWLESDAGGNKGSEYWGTKGADTLAYYETLTSGGGSEEQRAWFEKDYMTKDEMLDKLNNLGISTEELELAINEVKASTDTVGEKITETGNNTNTKLEEVGNNTNSKIEETNNNTNSKIDETKDNLNTSINDSKDTLNTSIESNRDETVTSLGDINNTIENRSDEIIGSIGDAASDIIGSIGSAASEISSSVGGAISSIRSEISSLRGSVTGATIGSIAGPIGTAIGGVIGGAIGKAKRYDTGGYTGDWGPEGKLAILDQKELVLNQNDTQNLLSTVSLIRELVSMIDAQAANASLFNLMSSPSPNTNTNTLEQKVEITAEFPNVNDRYEIEEAFNNLVNRASQYANKAF